VKEGKVNESTAMPFYKDGERTCPVCNDPLPAHQVWPGARYRYCLKAACKRQLFAGNRHGWHYIEAGERKCDAEGCSNFVSEGRHSNNASFKTCSAACYYACANAEQPARLCACGCGQEVRRISWAGSGANSVCISREHWGRYKTKKFLAANAGIFRPILDEYLSGFAETHYRNVSGVRSTLVPFFRFLNEQSLLSLEAVTPKVITHYIAWRNAKGCREVRVSSIKTFFNWSIQMGYREQANPVTSFHSPRRKKSAPRPYSAREMEFAWTLLNKRGNARVRFAVAIAEEAGLRLGEICRLRVQDIELTAQRCFVRLPNKTNCERFALFGNKTKQCFEAWMKERDPECGHDALLHNKRRKPCSKWVLTREMNRILCKTYEGRTVNEIGLERWSVHRLRHTMASNLVSGGADMKTVMDNGGWKSYDAACAYAAPDLHVARRGYHDAMRRVQEKKRAPQTVRTVTPAELLALRRQVRKHDAMVIHGTGEDV
jgi:integrase/recombinase XerC